MSRSRAIRIVMVAALQALLLVVAVWGSLTPRFTGQQVLLRVSAADPMDMFRGAYVDLRYPDLPHQPGTPVYAEPGGEASAMGTAYVPLSRQGQVWVGAEIVRTPPTSGIYLACDDSTWRLRCGIESYFLPQDAAATLGEELRDATAIAVVKVDRSGHAALVEVRAP